MDRTKRNALELHHAVRKYMNQSDHAANVQANLYRQARDNTGHILKGRKTETYQLP